MHVRLEIRYVNGTSSKTVVEEYQVLVIYTKAYNKWLSCAIGWKPRTQYIYKGKYLMLLRMTVFNYSIG